MSTRSYQDLIVWQKAMDFIEQVYALSKTFPSNESFGLTAQIRRAAVSIPSNIAEGQAKQSSSDFRRYLNISQGSRAEVETQLMIAQRLSCITNDELESALSLSNEIKRMIHILGKKLK